jgi:hypothetical protein
MPKGDIVGMFYRKLVLVIDGKNNNEPNLESAEDEKSQKRSRSRSVDEVQETDSQEEQRSRPLNT